VRERRLELLRASLRERLAGGEGGEEGTGARDLDRYRAVVEALADEYDAVEIALAAIALLDAEEARDDADVEIAPAALPMDRPMRPAGQPGRRPASGGPARWVPGPGAPGRWGQPGRPAVTRPPERPGHPDGVERRPGQPAGGAWVRLFVGGGRRAGIRPADLVGAITAEAGVPGSAIGAIQITDSFSLVDVADDVVEQVVRALRVATIRGRTLAVRLDREGR
jgi:ATP-dependent RNA helicase DeaD